MAGGKETPRQKMIGMMYLVLTALLALNVSKEILDAFVVMNNGLVKTDENFTKNNQLLYTSLKDALEVEPVRAKVPFENSQKVQKWTEELYKFTVDIKSEIIQAEEQIPKEVADTILLANVNSKDKYDQATRIMCGLTEDGSGGRARELKDKINEYKKNLLSVLDPEKAKTTNLGLDTSDPPRKGSANETWETNKFYHLPLAAQVSVLSQLQTEIRNAEGTVLNELVKSIGAKTIKVDQLQAEVIPSSSMVQIGDEFSAKIFVSAKNSSMTPDVTVNGRPITETDETGAIIYKVRPTTEGQQKITASVKFMNAEGKEEVSTREIEYLAMKPAATVSPTKMNVFYIGVPNPVSISAPGAAAANIDAQIDGSGGTLTKVKPGEYEVNVTTVGKCNISVTTKNASGKGTIPMGSYEFRVKRIPDPVPTVLGKKTGEQLSAKEFEAAGGVIAMLENFDFQARFVVKSFEFGANIDGNYIPTPVTGNTFPPQVIAQVKRLKPGSRIFLSDIKAEGPDKSVRTLNASFKIK